MTGRPGYRVTIEAFVPMADMKSQHGQAGAQAYTIRRIENWRNELAMTGATITKFAVEIVRADDIDMSNVVCVDCGKRMADVEPVEVKAKPLTHECYVCGQVWPADKFTHDDLCPQCDEDRVPDPDLDAAAAVGMMGERHDRTFCYECGSPDGHLCKSDCPRIVRLDTANTCPVCHTP